jgi:hypothetical protein
MLCSYIEINPGAIPFTSLFDGEACETFGFEIWDREENANDGSNNSIPPIVSPPPPGGSTPDVPNEMCYEVNILRFGNDDVFRPVFGITSDLLKEVDTGSVVYDDGDGSKARETGWARINWGYDSDHVDYAGLVGLPLLVSGTAVRKWLPVRRNRILSNYGGLFQHKGNVRRISPRSID